MSARKGLLLVTLALSVAVGSTYLLSTGGVIARVDHVHGDKLDSLNGVMVYCNGGFSGNSGRSVVDGYNIGLKYQCVEFVKRYYFERFQHRMPNSYGDARDLFDATVADGGLNKDRGLLQFKNGSTSKPRAEDLLILDGSGGNPFGHVAIISRVEDGEVEVVQQNTGSTRNTYDLDRVNGLWRIDSKRVLGWLRRK
ncbi:MAG TPA: CHAP domain-containing protein [Flavobacteriales bacterium]|nr:CHAP domain-containing protein [Flavobacteriales bacterium]